MDDAAIQRLHDESAIRRTLAGVLLALDGRRFEEYSQYWTEDGVCSRLLGRGAIYQSISTGAVATNTDMRRKHTSPNIVIDIEGDEAHAVSDLVMFTQYGNNPYSVRIGEYRDHLVREGDRWLIADRQIIVQPE